METKISVLTSQLNECMERLKFLADRKVRQHVIAREVSDRLMWIREELKTLLQN